MDDREKRADLKSYIILYMYVIDIISSFLTS